MKRIILLLAIAFPIFLIAQSPEKMISKGEYDKAIETCVDKLSGGKGNKDKLYASLKQAYETANQEDLGKIISMKATGNPEIWFDVFMATNAMQNRYLLLTKISNQLQRDMVNIQPVDYSKDLEAARQNAAAYLYAHSMSLLKEGTKADAGQAYSELLLITKLYNEYKDVALQMRRAIGGSTTLARLEVNNKSDANLSPDFIANMESIVLTYREKQYLDFIVKAEPGQYYSLLLAIDITLVNVSPGTVSEKEYTASHKNPETFADAYEDKSKFEEDKKHQDFNKCKITETYQVKSAVIKARVKYIDQPTGKVLYEVPVTAKTVFENKTATASGDMYACPPEIVEFLDKPKKKFPKNAEMIFNAGKELKLLVKEIVWNDAFIKD